jgi:hypothetical protein
MNDHSVGVITADNIPHLDFGDSRRFNLYDISVSDEGVHTAAVDL